MMKNDLYQRVVALSDSQRSALSQKLDQLTGKNAADSSLQRLFAYVVLHPGAVNVDPLSIKAALKEHLPAYMVPTAVVPLDSLPRTANGKIDVRTLPVSQFQKSLNSNQSVVPYPPARARTPVEESLLQIWQRVLGLSDIGLNDDFFDLGGDSILSIQIVSQARTAGFNIVPNQLFEQPTIVELAAVINLTAKLPGPQVNALSTAQLSEQKQQTTFFSNLVPIQPGGARRPFFFHGGSADALTWTKFSWLLGSDQPFYAMQRPDFNTQNVIHSTVEELAANCIQEIRQVQPTGPYLLGGHCFGGTVAFEIARQLQAQGEKIDSLIAVDAYCLSAAPRNVLSWLQTKLQLGYFTLRKSYYYHGGRKQLTQLHKKIWQRLRWWHNKSSAEKMPSAQPAANGGAGSTQGAIPEAAISYKERCDRAHQASIMASDRYQPQSYSGSIKLFRAEIQITDWLYGKDLGWHSVIPEKVEIENIPGLFGNLFNQRSGPLLAERIKSYLNSLQQT